MSSDTTLPPQCAAPLCIASRYQDSMHCRTHSRNFSVLHTKYKKAQIPINKYIDNLQAITLLNNEQLLRLVSVCNNVAKLRKEYQEVAFKKQFHDDGHTNFISRLLKMSDVITKLLEERFNTFTNTVPDESDYEEDPLNDLDSNPKQVIIKKSINEFLISHKQLSEELDILIKEKVNYISSIRENVLKIYDMVNPLLKDGNIAITDRAVAFICHLDIIGMMYETAKNEMNNEEFRLGCMIDNGFEDFSRLVEYDGETPRFNHVLPKSTPVINWLHTPSVEESIEYIYQGRRPFPSVPTDPKVIEAVAALIDVARKQKSTFSWHFDIDMFNDNKIHVHVCDVKGYAATYYPKDFKKR